MAEILISVTDKTKAFFDRISEQALEQREADYNKAAEELAKAQTALDVINNTIEFEVEL
jgi:hypothetical protein